MKRAVLVLSLLLALPGGATAQDSPEAAQQKRFLEMRRSRVDLQTERAELSRVESLFEQGLVSEADVERASAKEKKAVFDYQEALLNLASTHPRLSVRRAVKLEDDSGRKLVRLTLVNLTAGLGDIDAQALPRGDDELLQDLARFSSRPIRNVLVSLLDTGVVSSGNPSPLRGAAVALPYEHVIPEIGYQQTATLEFQLLRDVGSVLVHVAFGGQVQEIDVHLEQAAGQRPIAVSSTQISQELDLGSTASYDLRLHRPGIDEQSFGLRVVGLPPQILHSFREPGGAARLSRLHFPTGVTERDLELHVTLPDRLSGGLTLDEPLAFDVEVFPPEAAVAGSHAGSVRLELIPRGMGELEISAPTLFSEIPAAGGLESRLDLRNVGTRVLHDVRLTVEAPLRWEARVEPEDLTALAPGEERLLRLIAQPPENVPFGDYELRLKAESLGANRAIHAPEKIYRVRVEPSSGLSGTALVLGLLLALTAGMVVLGVRIARR